MLYHQIRNLIPDHDSFPSEVTAWLSTALLVLSLCIGLVVVKLPTPSTPNAFMGILYLFSLLIVSSLIFDLRRKLRPHRPNAAWNSNLMSTIATSLLTLWVLPILYRAIWHQQLNDRTVRLEEDSVESIRFPSIALFQRVDWSSQANITVSPQPKCFLGWHDEDAPPCSTVPPGPACSCGQNWDLSISRDYEWQGVKYNMLSLRSSKDLMSMRPTFLMIAQAFFYYDKAKAIADSSRASSPGLWLAFYDPALDINQALEGGNTRLHLIDANGEVAINLGITRRQKQGEGLLYDYQLAISSVPSLDLNCDTSSGSNSACFVSLLVQFPNFERRTLRTEPTLGWTDAIAEAGAWFSFFQIVGWIFSGMSVKV